MDRHICRAKQYHITAWKITFHNLGWFEFNTLKLCKIWVLIDSSIYRDVRNRTNRTHCPKTKGSYPMKITRKWAKKHKYRILHSLEIQQLKVSCLFRIIQTHAFQRFFHVGSHVMLRMYKRFPGNDRLKPFTRCHNKYGAVTPWNKQ